MENLVKKKCSINQAIEMGLSKEEFKFICKKINKIPNVTEAGICSAMFQNIALIKYKKMVENLTNIWQTSNSRAW